MRVLGMLPEWVEGGDVLRKTVFKFKVFLTNLKITGQNSN